MTNRLYFMAEDQQQALSLVQWLSATLDKEHINVLARHDKKLLSEELPNAPVSETSDLKGAAIRGAAVGSVMFAGLLAAVVPPIGAIATAGVVAGGAVLGSWSATLIGISVPNSDVEKFESSIEAGKVLVYADATGEQSQELKARMRSDEEKLRQFQLEQEIAA